MTFAGASADATNSEAFSDHGIMSIFSPDNSPIIGPAPRHRNLWFSFGHAHHGLTLGPVTGRLVADLVTGEKPFVDPAPYRADRF